MIWRQTQFAETDPSTNRDGCDEQWVGKKCSGEVTVSQLMHRAQRTTAGAVEVCQFVELASGIERVFDGIEEI